MTITRFLVLAAVATSTFAADPSSAQAIGETNPFATLTGNRFHGTWIGTATGPTPLVISFAASGVFTAQSAFARGGYALQERSFSEVIGSWRRNGPRSLEMVGSRYVYLGDGKVFAIERVQANYSFGESFDEMSGDLTLEEFLCEDVEVPQLPFETLPSCPDIQTAMPDVVRGPGPSSLQRLQFVSDQ